MLSQKRNWKFLGKNKYELAVSVLLLLGAAPFALADVRSLPLTLAGWLFYWLAFFCAVNALEDRQNMSRFGHFLAQLWMCFLLVLLFSIVCFPTLS